MNIRVALFASWPLAVVVSLPLLGMSGVASAKARPRAATRPTPARAVGVTDG